MSSKSTGRFQTPGAFYRAFLKAVVFEVKSAFSLVGEAAFQMGRTHRRVRRLKFD